MEKTKTLHSNAPSARILILLILLFLLSVSVFNTAILVCYGHIHFLSSIRGQLEYDFGKAFYERDISYIDKHFDNDTIFEFDDKTLKYGDVKKNIINALNNSKIIYPEYGTTVCRFNKELFFSKERYFLDSYIVNPYQSSETCFFINVKVLDKKSFVITKIEISDKEPFWKYFFGGESA